MNPSTLFQLASTVAMISWIVLVIFPFRRWAHQTIFSVSIMLLCLLYAGLIVSTFDPGGFGDFGSLSGVMSLFTSPWAVLAGWVHYLAFDLIVGLYIVTNASKNGINRWIIIPSLFFTFMLGPFGLLTYVVIRAVISKSFFRY